MVKNKSQKSVKKESSLNSRGNIGSSKRKVKIPKTTQDTLPFLECYQDGTIQTEIGKFTRTMKIDDISFRTQSDEEQSNIYENYQKLLNSLSADEQLFLTFVNAKEDPSETLDAVLPQMTGDNFDIYRQEISDMIKDKVVHGRNNIKTTKYATLKVEAPSVDAGINKINFAEGEFKAAYKKISRQTPVSLSIADRLHLADNILNGANKNPWFKKENNVDTLDLKAMNAHGMGAKDIICPESLKFSGNYFEINNRYGQAFYLDSIANWMSTNFIADLSEVNFESCFTIHIKPIPQTEAVKKVHTQSVNINAEVAEKFKKSDSGYLSTDLKNATQQIEDLQEDLMNRDQKLFYMSLAMVIFADTKEELKEQELIIKNLSSKYMSRIQPLLMQQQRGLSSALPFGVNKTFTTRLLTTESLGVFIPFDEVNVFDKNGIYYGTNTINKSLIVYDRLKGQNYNGLVLGSSGSGKSFSSKREMTNVILRDDACVYIIDPDREYTPLANTFDGSVIKIAPGNGVYINPFDLDIDISHDSDFNPMTMKTDFICGMIETMIGSNTKLTPIQKSIIDTCVKQIYTPYIEHLVETKKTIDRDFCPTMQNLFDALLSTSRPEAQNLALIMETYTTGTFDTFAHRTNVDLSNSLIVYDIYDIGTNLKELALKICTNDIWNKMMENRRKNKWTWFYIDEFHLLMKNDSTSEFLKTIWKRARKWQGVPTGITQDVEDILDSSEARTIFNNSSFIYMMNQSKICRDELVTLLSLSENDAEFITNAEIGCGLIYNGKQSIPFTDVFPENTELFKVMTTKAKRDE